MWPAGPRMSAVDDSGAARQLDGKGIMLQCIVIGAMAFALGVALFVFLQRTGHMATQAYDRYWPLRWHPSLRKQDFQLISVAALALGFGICVALQGALALCVQALTP